MRGNRTLVLRDGEDLLAFWDEATLLAYIDLLRQRRNDMCDLSCDVSLGKARTEDHVIFHMNVMLDAQKAVLDMLDA